MYVSTFNSTCNLTLRTKLVVTVWCYKQFVSVSVPTNVSVCMCVCMPVCVICFHVELFM